MPSNCWQTQPDVGYDGEYGQRDAYCTQPDSKSGIHFCLGAQLARLEARVVIETLLDRFPHLERTDEPVKWGETLLVRGPKMLQLRAG